MNDHILFVHKATGSQITKKNQDAMAKRRRRVKIQFERDKRQFRKKNLKDRKQLNSYKSKTKMAECTTNSKDRGAHRERTDTQEGFQKENKDRKVLMCGWTGRIGGTAQTVHSWMDNFRAEQEACG